MPTNTVEVLTPALNEHEKQHILDIWYIVMLWCGMLSSPGFEGCITVKWKGFSELTRLLYF